MTDKTLNLMAVLDQLHLTAMQAKELKHLSASVLDTMYGTKPIVDNEEPIKGPTSVIDQLLHVNSQINSTLEQVSQHVTHLKALIG